LGLQNSRRWRRFAAESLGGLDAGRHLSYLALCSPPGLFRFGATDGGGNLRLWLGRLVCLVAISAVAGMAWADVTLSKSNAPAAIMDAQLAQLFWH